MNLGIDKIRFQLNNWTKNRHDTLQKPTQKLMKIRYSGLAVVETVWLAIATVRGTFSSIAVPMLVSMFNSPKRESNQYGYKMRPNAKPYGLQTLPFSLTINEIVSVLQNCWNVFPIGWVVESIVRKSRKWKNRFYGKSHFFWREITFRLAYLPLNTINNLLVTLSSEFSDGFDTECIDFWAQGCSRDAQRMFWKFWKFRFFHDFFEKNRNFPNWQVVETKVVATNHFWLFFHLQGAFRMIFR